MLHGRPPCRPLTCMSTRQHSKTTAMASSTARDPKKWRVRMWCASCLRQGTLVRSSGRSGTPCLSQEPRSGAPILLFTDLLLL